MPKDIYNKKISEVETEIINKKIKLNDFEDSRLDVDDIIDRGKEFLLDLPNLWVNCSIDKKRKLQDYLFPKEIYLENNEFRTTQMSSVLRVIEDKNYSQSILAGEGGFEPPITRPKPVALPLGHSPIKLINFISNLHKIQTLVIRFKAIIDLGIIYLNNSKLNK